MRSRVSLIVSAVVLVAMCVFIFAMSAFPADESTVLSTGVIWHIVGFIVPGYDQMPPAEQLQWQEALQFPVRKTAHFLEYALLGFLALNLVMRLGSRLPLSKGGKVALAWAFCVAYSIGDEVHQMFVPGRTGKVMDVAIDSVGALVGIGVLLLVLWACRKAGNRKRGAAAPRR